MNAAHQRQYLGTTYRDTYRRAAGRTLATIQTVEVTVPVDDKGGGSLAPCRECREPVLDDSNRSGARRTGRIYTIAVEARDASGNTTVQTVEVKVPLER